MSQNAVKRLYLMQVGSMPEYQIPIVCLLHDIILCQRSEGVCIVEYAWLWRR